jgi:hypothetical protein
VASRQASPEARWQLWMNRMSLPFLWTAAGRSEAADES